MNGFTVDQCFEQWIYKGWRGFEADWMPRQTAAQNKPIGISNNMQRNLQNTSEWGND